jgi:hypothetical protein
VLKTYFGHAAVFFTMLLHNLDEGSDNMRIWLKWKTVVWALAFFLIVSVVVLFSPFEDSASNALQSINPVKTRSTYYTPEKVEHR